MVIYIFMYILDKNVRTERISRKSNPNWVTEDRQVFRAEFTGLILLKS